MNGATQFFGTASNCEGASGSTNFRIWDKTAQPLGPGVGGNCGIHPRTYLVYHQGGITHAMHYASIKAATEGWQRKLITDAQCRDLTTQAETWVRAESPVYSDRLQSALIEVPTCPANSVAKVMRAQRVPINVSCTLGTVCYGNNSIIYQHTLPTANFTTATQPEWMPCLTSDVNCGVPTTVQGVCVWGTYTVDTGACEPGQIAASEISTVPGSVPKETGTITPKPYAGVATATTDPAGNTTTTTVPPSPGTITVPIDPGSGQNTGTLEEQQAECWPDGWGWFNPAQWVLRPIKCAAEWAFVPSSLALQTRMQRIDTLQDSPPITWVNDGSTYVQGASFLFAEWSVAGPDCTTVLDTSVCPREWDNAAAVPGYLLGAVMFGLWSSLVFAIWRWF
jgi:hypothetical protein